jgi:hypothetical protein
MQKITKYLPLVIALCAIADTQFDLLLSIGLDATLINYIKLLGLILAIFLPSIDSLFEEEKTEAPILDKPLLKSESIDPNEQYGKAPKDRRKKGELDEEQAI